MEKHTLLVAYAFFYIALAVKLFLDGLMLSFLWQWFMTPLGIIAIDIKESVGLLLILKYCSQIFLYDNNADSKPVKVFGVLHYMIFLVAFIVHNWF